MKGYFRQLEELEREKELTKKFEGKVSLAWLVTGDEETEHHSQEDHW